MEEWASGRMVWKREDSTRSTLSQTDPRPKRRAQAAGLYPPEGRGAVRHRRTVGPLGRTGRTGHESCTLLTTEPNDMLAPIHNRMPMILAPKDYEQWLDPEQQVADGVKPLLRPYPSDLMTVYAISLRVNNPKNDDSRCLEPWR